jgi:hypothetical protein
MHRVDAVSLLQLGLDLVVLELELDGFRDDPLQDGVGLLDTP